MEVIDQHAPLDSACIILKNDRDVEIWTVEPKVQALKYAYKELETDDEKSLMGSFSKDCKIFIMKGFYYAFGNVVSILKKSSNFHNYYFHQSYSSRHPFFTITLYKTIFSQYHLLSISFITRTAIRKLPF